MDTVSSDWMPKDGETIDIGPDTEFKMVDVDEANQRVLLEFEHKGRKCRIWTPMAMLEDQFEVVPAKH